MEARHTLARWHSILATIALAALSARAVHLVASGASSAQPHRRAPRQGTARGRILATDGAVLAENVAGREVDVAPSELARAPWAIDRLGAMLGYDDTAALHGEVARAVERRTRVLRLRRNVDEAVARRLRAERRALPGVWITEVPRRRYPFGELAAYPVGFMGDVDERDLAEPVGYRRGDRIGRAGVERSWELTLRGVSTHAPERQGMTLVTTLDPRLQTAAARALGDHPGALVALDPRDGSVLAYVTRPAVDPMRFEGDAVVDYGVPRAWPAQPLADRVGGETSIDGAFPDLLSVLMAVAGGEDGACAPSRDSGELRVAAMERAARSLGLDKVTGIDLRDEVPGRVAVATESPRDDGRVARQRLALEATPLGIAVAFSAVANGGALYQPRLVDRVQSPAGVTTYRALPVVRGRVTIPSCVRETVFGALMRPVADEAESPSSPPVAAWMRTPHRSVVAVSPPSSPELVVVALSLSLDAAPDAPDPSVDAARSVVRAWHERHATGGTTP